VATKAALRSCPVCGRLFGPALPRRVGMAVPFCFTSLDGAFRWWFCSTACWLQGGAAVLHDKTKAEAIECEPPKEHHARPECVVCFGLIGEDEVCRGGALGDPPVHARCLPPPTREGVDVEHLPPIDAAPPPPEPERTPLPPGIAIEQQDAPMPGVASDAVDRCFECGQPIAPIEASEWLPRGLLLDLIRPGVTPLRRHVRCRGLMGRRYQEAEAAEQALETDAAIESRFAALQADAVGADWSDVLAWAFEWRQRARQAAGETDERLPPMSATRLPCTLDEPPCPLGEPPCPAGTQPLHIGHPLIEAWCTLFAATIVLVIQAAEAPEAATRDARRLLPEIECAVAQLQELCADAERAAPSPLVAALLALQARVGRLEMQGKSGVEGSFPESF